jgi:nicotinamidase-related amidase
VTSRNRTALVVLDVQNGIFAREQSLVHDAEGVLDRIDEVVRAAAARDTPVVIVQDDAGPGLWTPETPGWQLHERLIRPPKAVALRKSYGDAFRGTDLECTAAISRGRPPRARRRDDRLHRPLHPPASAPKGLFRHPRR